MFLSRGIILLKSNITHNSSSLKIFLELQIHGKQHAWCDDIPSADFEHVLLHIEILANIWCNFEIIDGFSEIFF